MGGIAHEAVDICRALTETLSGVLIPILNIKQIQFYAEDKCEYKLVYSKYLLLPGPRLL